MVSSTRLDRLETLTEELRGKAEDLTGRRVPETKATTGAGPKARLDALERQLTAVRQAVERHVARSVPAQEFIAKGGRP